MILDTNSKILPNQPSKLVLPLRRHQQAMLYQCLMIEKIAKQKDLPYGIIKSKAGTGKTAVIISIILADKEIYGKTQNLIVVPQNIHTQWISEVKKFAGNSLKVSSFTNYSDISGIYFDPSILIENDILVTTEKYYELIEHVINQNGCNLRRIVFDEIDSISNIINNVGSKIKLLDEVAKVKDTPHKNHKMTWFVSASFDNILGDDHTFNFKDKKVLCTSEVICDCSDEFVDKFNFVIQPPDITQVICYSITDDYYDCLSIDQLDDLNSLSFQGIYSKYFTDSCAYDSKSAIKILVKDCHYVINTKTKNGIDSLIRSNSNKNEYDNEISKINKDCKFNTKLLQLFHSVKCNSNCEDTLECINHQIDNLPDDDKISQFLNFLSNIDSTAKILIFSDLQRSFKNVSQALEYKGIKYAYIAEGNIKDIDINIQNYKNGNVDVLMIDSKTNGCGMNLENTEYLIFIHKTSEILYNQIVGRAQRPGRTNILKIITFINKNEIV
jgi:SNF2 domain-containing protein/helicase-like protein